MIKFSVEDPVSINSLIGLRGNRKFETKEYVSFKENVKLIVDGLNIEKPIVGDLYCNVVFYTKNKTRRDLDNYAFKGLFDAIVEAGLIVDDSFFYRLNAVKSKVNPRKCNWLEVEIGII